VFGLCGLHLGWGGFTFLAPASPSLCLTPRVMFSGSRPLEFWSPILLSVSVLLRRDCYSLGELAISAPRLARTRNSRRTTKFTSTHPSFGWGDGVEGGWVF